MIENPDRLESLFAAAAALPPDARNAYLDRECAGDAALRERLVALLRAHDRAGHLLDKPEFPLPDRTGAYGSNEVQGSVIAGRYKLLEEIGEGGMGTVWVAEQTEPLKRKVALKLIKTGMDSRSVLARFEAERQALALMDHPNIAKVFDGGLTESGRPFFVMEYVKGVPITEYCDSLRLSVSARLNLFVQVCSAVQHAHQKGIIHRDLKPSNILVAPYDDKPVPKVIDFGLAKAMHQALTERTLHTAHETVLGTPLYMSPEQAQLNNLDVDTRSDVYSLGVLLYELLTGTTPLEKKRFKEAAWDEIRRIISDEEPPRPSTRLSSTDKLATLAACRQIEPAGLTRLVRGDLDWIVMKALEKQRTRRYETASGFALDVQRYLAGEAVLAVPPSTSYRLRKFLRRHRPQALAASLILLALLAGIAGTTWGLFEARRQQQFAEVAGERETQRADSEAKERQRADEEKERAIRFRDLALDALRATTGDDVEKLLGSKKELGAREREYLEAIAKRWQVFAGQAGTEADARAYQAEAHFRVASLWQKLGRREEARAEYRSACDKWKTLADQFPDAATYLQESAKSHLNLGILLAELGQPAEAQREIKSALDMQSSLARRHPDVVEYQRLLGVHRCNFGALLIMLGKGNEARTEFEAARDLQKTLVERFPSQPIYRRELGHTHTSLGLLLVQLGKRQEALIEYQAARNLQKALVEQFPAATEHQVDLADTRNHLGSLFVELGKLDLARPEYIASHDLRKALAEQYPAVPAYQIDLGGSCCNCGNLIRDEGNPADSLEWFGRAIRVLQQVHRKEPLDARAKEYLRNSHIGRAQSLEQLKKRMEAASDWDQAIELSPPAERPRVRANRALSRFQSGAVAEAIAEVSELTQSPTWTAGEWYNFACVYSIASAKIADKKQEYGKRAVNLLRRAVDAGFDDAAQMKEDTDLDPLRNREDFDMLLKSLPKSVAPEKR